MLRLRFLPAPMLLAAAACQSAQEPKPANPGVLIDGAAIFSADEERALDQELQSLSRFTAHGAAIVTVSALKDVSSSSYADRIMRQTRKSVVILIAPNDRQVTIWVNRPLLPTITQSEAQAIIKDEITPYFRKRQMYAGTASGLKALRRELDHAASHGDP